MIYHKDWAGNEYENKNDVVKAVLKGFIESTDFADDPSAEQQEMFDAVKDHFGPILKRLDERIVKQIMEIQDQLFFADN